MNESEFRQQAASNILCAILESEGPIVETLTELAYRKQLIKLSVKMADELIEELNKNK